MRSRLLLKRKQSPRSRPAPAISRSAERNTDRGPHPCVRTRVPASKERRASRGCHGVCGRPPRSRGPVGTAAPPSPAKATRVPKAASHGLRANSAPVSGSRSVRMNGAAAARARSEHPARHNAWKSRAVACSAMHLRTFRREILMGSPIGTYMSRSSSMPREVCSNLLYPWPCLTT